MSTSTSLNPFSDPFIYLGRNTEIQRILKYANVNNRLRIKLYGPRCVGKKTIAVHILSRPSFRGNSINTFGISNSSSTFGGLGSLGTYSIFIRPFTRHEIEQYIQTGLKIAGRDDVKLTSDFLKMIQVYSSGSPCVASVVMYHVFEVLRKNETWISVGHFEKSRKFIEKDLWIRYFNEIYKSLSSLEFQVLKYGVLGSASNGGLFPLVDISKKMGKDLRIITKIVCRLTKKGILYREKRGMYKIFSQAFINIISKLSHF